MPSEIPMAVREMIAVGAGEAVRSEAPERHPAQSAVCTYVQECLGSIRARQAQILEEEKAAKSQDEPQLQSLQAQLATADTEIERVAAVVEMRKLGLAEAQRVLTEAKANLTEAQYLQAAPSAQKTSLDKLAVKYSKFDEGPLKIIVEGIWDNEKAAKIASKQVMDEIARMDDMEEAFLVAMPGTLAKRHSERSSFDNMVLTTLQGKFADRSNVLVSKVAEAEAALAPHQEKVAKSTAIVDESSKARDTAEAELKEALAQHASAVEARQELEIAIEKQAEASMNRDNLVAQAELYIELLEETAVDFKSVAERSAAAEAAAAAAAAAEAAEAAAASVAAAAETATDFAEAEDEHPPAAA